MTTVDAAVAAADRALRAHAGGLELLDVSDGVATVAFTGMCTGCPARPLTLAATVAPLLTAADGVTAVTAPGTRVSPFAARRLAALGGPSTLPPPRPRGGTTFPVDHPAGEEQR